MLKIPHFFLCTIFTLYWVLQFFSCLNNCFELFSVHLQGFQRNFLETEEIALNIPYRFLTRWCCTSITRNTSVLREIWFVFFRGYCNAGCESGQSYFANHFPFFATNDASLINVFFGKFWRMFGSQHYQFNPYYVMHWCLDFFEGRRSKRQLLWYFSNTWCGLPLSCKLDFHNLEKVLFALPTYSKVIEKISGPKVSMECNVLISWIFAMGKLLLHCPIRE